MKLKVYDFLGKELITLVDEYKQAGIYHFTFNIHQTNGGQALHSALASGVYFYRLQAGSYSQTKKLLVIK
ncbi:MAG: T9SS type A sorting domain-containing protein [Bacteroidetes bacterium]|nr:T9SS type A sorting domain-containing protein [Bacteroidota bacterium]